MSESTVRRLAASTLRPLFWSSLVLLGLMLPGKPIHAQDGDETGSAAAETTTASTQPADPVAESAQPAGTQDPGATDGNPPDAAADEPSGEGDENADDKEEREPPLRERSIYIPYDKLRDVFEKPGRGVFLPYEEFEALWRAARNVNRPQIEPVAPVSAVITEIDNVAHVAKDVVEVKARIRLEILKKGWAQLPLRLTTAAITKAEIEGEPARLIYDPNLGYTLLWNNEQQSSVSVELNLNYVRAISKTPGRNSVMFDAPQAPVNRWEIHIPEKGAKVEIDPLVAATDISAQTADGDAAPQEPVETPPADAGAQPADAAAAENAETPEETVILAFVGAAPNVQISWTPKAEGASGLEALTQVDLQQVITVAEGMVHVQATLTYTISRSELSELQVDVPADFRVVNVVDANVRQWNVTPQEGGRQRIVAQLFEPTRGVQNLQVELEKFTPQEEQQEITAPVIEAVDVGRQQGHVVVKIAEGLRAEVSKRLALIQLDQADLPQNLTANTWEMAFRYVTVPYDLTLRVEKILPRVLADELTEVILEPDQINLYHTLLLQVERAGIFQIELDLPVGFDVRRVTGVDFAGGSAIAMDAFQEIPGENGARKLVINLARKALGNVALMLHMHRRLEDPNLLTPTGSASTLNLAPPRVTGSYLERSSGRLVIWSPESLRITAANLEGLRALAPNNAFDKVPMTAEPRSGQITLAYAYSQGAASLELSAERRKPHVTVSQLLVARVEDGVVRYEATFYYTVLYSAVSKLRIDLPAVLAEQIRNVSPDIQDTVMEPQPEDVTQGYVAREFTGESEFINNVQIRLNWEQKMDAMVLGEQKEFTLPSLRPMNTDRAMGQIVLVKAETIDIQPAGEPQGLRPIDPQYDLLQGASVPDGALAYEFLGDWNLAIAATQFELEEVKHTSIERAVVRVVCTRSNRLTVQALYRLKSAQQRLAVVLPDGIEFDAEPARMNGESVSLERGNQNEYFIPLTNYAPDEQMLLELRYTIAGGPGDLLLPEFPQDPAVQKVYVVAYLPNEWALLGVRGDWTNEQYWMLEPPLRWVQVSPPSDASLVSWVGEGVPAYGNPMGSFATDGEAYVFSTLRPAPAPAGTLHLRTMNETLLHALTFGAVLLFGLLFVSRPWRVRIIAVLFVATVLVLLAVFAPVFASRIADASFVMACGLVLLIWLAMDLVRLRPTKWFSGWPQFSLAGAGAHAATGSVAETQASTGSSVSESAKKVASPFAEAASESSGTSAASSQASGGSTFDAEKLARESGLGGTPAVDKPASDLPGQGDSDASGKKE